MPRVLIAGCGYVGAAAAKRFREKGWAVEGWIRTRREVRPEYDLRTVDLSDEKQVRAAPGSFDLVIHSASTGGGDAAAYGRVYLNGARHLMERFSGAPFLFVSSTSVYGQREGEWVTEESAADPQHERGQVLRAAENFVLDRAGTVARFAGIYGPGRSALLEKLLRNEAVIDPGKDRFVNQVHRDDAASALLRLGEIARDAGIYNVSDDLPLLWSECYRWLAKRLERAVPPFVSASTSRKRGNSNKRVSNAKLRRAGWIPQFASFMEGMEKSVLAVDQDSGN